MTKRLAALLTVLLSFGLLIPTAQAAGYAELQSARVNLDDRA
jgi:hypothetical protein